MKLKGTFKLTVFFLFTVLSTSIFAASTTVTPNPGYAGDDFTFTLIVNTPATTTDIHLELGDGVGGWLDQGKMNVNFDETTFDFTRPITLAGYRLYRYGIYLKSNGSFVGHNPASGGYPYDVLEPQPPIFISGVSIRDTPGGFDLRWNVSTTANRYELYRSLSSGVLGTAIFSGNSSLTYIDTGLSVGQTYYYTARACNNFGCTVGTQDFKLYDEQLTTPLLLTPVDNSNNISKTAQGYGWIGAPGATGYRVVVSEYRDFRDFNDTQTDSSNCIDTSTCTTVKVTSSFYTGFSLKPNKKYYWKIRAGSATIPASDWSNTWSFTTTADSNTPAPDLVIASITVDHTTISVGQGLLISAIIKNEGNVISNSSRLHYHSSPDSTITPSDNELSGDNFSSLQPNETASERDRNTISIAGFIYVGVCADSVSGEINTANNCSNGIRINVNTDPLAPDIRIDSFNIDKTSINSGDQVRLDTIIANSGSATSPSGILRYFYSKDSVISPSDTSIGAADSFTSLLFDRTTSETEYINFNVPAGTYYLGACADPIPGEKSSSNNCSVAKKIIVIQPNYRIDVTTSGLGTGTITSSPAGINCTSGSTLGCSTSFNASTVILQGNNDVNSRLTSWGGDCASSGNSTNCTLTLDSNKTVTADFASLIPVLTQENTIAPVFAPIISLSQDVILSLKAMGSYDIVEVKWTGGKAPLNQSRSGVSGDVFDFAYPLSVQDTGKTISWSAKASLFTSSTTVESVTLTGSFYVAEKLGDCLKYLQDISIPDGSQLLIGSAFNKTWDVKNCGTHIWNNYTLNYYRDANLSTSSSVAIANGINPGDAVNITVPMQVPNSTGRYRSYWKAKNNTSLFFDEELFADILAVTKLSTTNNTKASGKDGAVTIAQTDALGTCKAADPIDTGTGAQTFTLPLLSVAGLRDLSFVASYNSLVLSSGSMGKGWGHNYETYLKEEADGTVRVSWRSNREDFYNLEPDGSYTANKNEILYNTLVKNPDGTFLLSLKNKARYLFNTEGKLLEEVNAQDQKLSYSYTGFGLISSVTEPVSGVYLQFNYDTVFRLASVSDPIGRDVEFIYNSAGLIEGYKDALDNQTSYILNGTGQLVSGTNAEGIEFFHNTFDSDGRVIYQKSGRNIGTDLFAIDYSGDIGDPTYPIILTDRLGASKTIIYQNEYLINEIFDELGNTTQIFYDNENNPIKIIDPKGREILQDFDNHGNIISITNVLGHTISRFFDQNDNLTSETDAEGNNTQYTYNNQHNILTITDAKNQVTSFTYTSNAQLETIRTPQGRTTHFEYTKGLLSKIIDPQGLTTLLAYDNAGRLTSLTDADGFTTTFVLDALDRIIEVINPLGHKIATTYDSRDNVLSIIDSELNTTLYEYNANNFPIKSIDAKGFITQLSYDSNDRLSQITDPKGAVTTLVYDNKGRTVGSIDALGNTTKSEYDETDQIVKTIDSLSQETLYNVNEIDNLIEVSNALNQVIRFNHDKNRNIIEVIDQLGRRNLSRYDALQRLIETTDAIGGKASQSYSEDGEMLALTDPNNNQTSFDYSLRGLLTSETTASGSQTQYSHNGRGLITQITNGRGQITQNTFDAASRLTQSIDEVGTTDYRYDKNDNLLGVTDAQGSLIREHGALNRVGTYTNTAGEKLEFLYDENSNLKTLIYPDGKRVEYSYDELNRLITVIDWAGRTTQYEYNANSLLSRTIRPNGSIETRKYNAINQLIEQKDLTAIVEVIYQVNYVLDKVGNIIEEIINPQPDIEAIQSSIMDYTAGNRIGSITRSQKNFSIAKSFDFDLDGNNIKAPFKGVDSDLVFNARNQLVSALGFSFLYDAEGYRTQLTNKEGITTRFTVNPEAVLSQVLASHSEGISTYFVYGLGLIGQEVDGVYRSYHYDYRGSTVALTDNTGVITDRFSYTPFADLASHTGTTDTPFQYNGRDGVMNDNNGLYYMRARYYAPEFHRFINRDVLLGGIASSKTLNRYGYVEGNPVMGIDPLGLDAIDLANNLVSNEFSNYIDNSLELEANLCTSGNNLSCCTLALGSVVTTAWKLSEGLQFWKGLLKKGVKNVLKKNINNVTKRNKKLSGKNPHINQARQDIHINGTSKKSQFKKGIDVDMLVKDAWMNGVLKFNKNNKFIKKINKYKFDVGTKGQTSVDVRFSRKNGIHGFPSSYKPE